MDGIPGKKRGFLNEDYRIFHLKDSNAPQVEYHYHDFDKAVLLLSGGVTYYMEGTPYELCPGDLLFVPHGSIHKPVISAASEYERYVVWTTPAFLRSRDEGLSLCFDMAGPVEGYLRHTEPKDRLELLKSLSDIHEASLSDSYMARQMSDSLFTCFMIKLCRLYLSGLPGARAPAPDPKIEGVMRYIDANLGGDLSIERLSSVFFVSRYHLMRRFKQQSGYTLHQYITRRRVLAAAAMIVDGVPVSEAAEAVGYRNYSSFLRSFRAIFKTTPGRFTSIPAHDEIFDE